MEANYVRYIFEIVMNVFLLQAWMPNRTIYYSLNGVAWYLSVCTFIYAMFPCILARLKRFDTVKQAMAILISVYFLQIGTALLLMGYGSNSLLKWYTYICPIYRLGDFCIGCCLGYLYVNHSFSFSKKTATLLEIATCLFLSIYQVEVIRKINNPMVNAFYTPLAIAIVLMFALHKGAITNVLRSRLLQYIGNVSPYLFLTHQMVIRYLEKVIAIVFGVQNTFWQSKTVLIILALCVSIIVSECYLFLERKAKNKASRKY